jgi:hypothetical protein
LLYFSPDLNISDFLYFKLKTMRRLLVFILLLTLWGCGPQRKLQRSYVGKSLAEIKQDFGEPKTAFESDEGKVYIFEKQEDLKGTVINQGRLSLDPMVTPKVQKTERYYVTVVHEVVTKITVENDYERQ